MCLACNFNYNLPDINKLLTHERFVSPRSASSCAVPVREKIIYYTVARSCNSRDSWRKNTKTVNVEWPLIDCYCVCYVCRPSSRESCKSQMGRVQINVGDIYIYISHTGKLHIYICTCLYSNRFPCLSKWRVHNTFALNNLQIADATTQLFPKILHTGTHAHIRGTCTRVFSFLLKTRLPETAPAYKIYAAKHKLILLSSTAMSLVGVADKYIYKKKQKKNVERGREKEKRASARNYFKCKNKSALYRKIFSSKQRGI